MRVDLSHNKHIGKIMDVAQTLPRDGDRITPRWGNCDRLPQPLPLCRFTFTLTHSETNTRWPHHFRSSLLPWQARRGEQVSHVPTRAVPNTARPAAFHIFYFCTSARRRRCAQVRKVCNASHASQLPYAQTTACKHTTFVPACDCGMKVRTRDARTHQHNARTNAKHRIAPLCTLHSAG